MKFVDAIKLIKNNYKFFLKNSKINEIVSVLRKLSFLYYNKKEGSPISDEIYDKIYEYVKENDPNNIFLKEVGSSIEKNMDKVELPYKMSSLEKIKSMANKIIDFTGKYEGPYMMSAKLDGTSLQFYKDDNGNIKLFTRGDGVYGKDVTYLLPFIIDKININKIPNDYSVRGELIISKENFDDIINKKGKIYSNARQISNSIVNTKPKDIDIDIASNIDFVTYSILNPRMLIFEQFKELKKYGFNVVKHKIIDTLNVELLSTYLKDWRKKYEYNIDGIVIVDNSNIYDINEDRPKFAFAFKTVLEDQMAEVVVEEVIWQKSRYGYLKPKIKFEPVEIGGIEIKHATAHNAKYVVDNILGIGSVVTITRSGDVIPFILEVLKPSENGKPLMPEEKYEWNDTNVDILVNKETMEDDIDIKIKQITHFFKTIKIKHLSEKTIKKFVEEGYDNEFKILKANREKLAEIDGLGEKSIAKIFEGIDERMTQLELETLMDASGVFGRLLGTTKLKLITDKYPDISSLKEIVNDVYEKVLEIDGFGEKLAENVSNKIKDFFKYFEKINKIYDLKYLIKKSKTKKMKTNKNNLLNGKIIVFTGFRDLELQKKIEENGGKVTTSVSGKTDIVICADDSEPTGKIQKAIEKGIKVIKKTDFLKEYHF